MISFILVVPAARGRHFFYRKQKKVGKIMKDDSHVIKTLEDVLDFEDHYYQRLKWLKHQSENNGNLHITYDPVYDMIHMCWFGHACFFGEEKLAQFRKWFDLITDSNSKPLKQAILRLNWYIEFGENRMQADVFTALLDVCQRLPLEHLQMLLPVMRRNHFELLCNIPNNIQSAYIVYYPYPQNTKYCIQRQRDAWQSNVFKELEPIVAALNKISASL